MDPQSKCKLPVYREFQVEPRLSLQAVLPESHNHLMKHHMEFVNPKFYSKSSSNVFKKRPCLTFGTIISSKVQHLPTLLVPNTFQGQVYATL